MVQSHLSPQHLITPGAEALAVLHMSESVLDQPGENVHWEVHRQVDQTGAGGSGPAVEGSPDRLPLPGALLWRGPGAGYFGH